MRFTAMHRLLPFSVVWRRPLNPSLNRVCLTLPARLRRCVCCTRCRWIPTEITDGPSSPASLHPALIPRGGGSSRGPVWSHEEVAGHPPRVFQGFLLFSWTEGIKLAAMERKVGMQRRRVASLSASVYTANSFSAFVISKRFCLARECILL